MALGYGTAKGLAFSENWQEDIDNLYRTAEYAEKIRTEKERKAEFLADKLKPGYVPDDLKTNQELQDLYQNDLNPKLVKFVTENPNFLTDVRARQEFDVLSAKYLQNDILARGLQARDSFLKMQEAASQGKLTLNQSLKEAEKYHLSTQPGYQGDPYVFIMPKEIDIHKLIEDTVAVIPRGALKISTKTFDGNKYLYESRPLDPVQTRSAAYNLLADEDNYDFFEKAYNNNLKSDPGLKTLYPNIQEFVFTLLKNANKEEDVFRGPDPFALNEQEGRISRENKGTTGLPAGAGFWGVEYPRLESVMKADPGTVQVRASAPTIALTKAGKINGSIWLSGNEGFLYRDENNNVRSVDLNSRATVTGIGNYVNTGDPNRPMVEHYVQIVRGSHLEGATRVYDDGLDDTVMKANGFSFKTTETDPLVNIKAEGSPSFSRSDIWEAKLIGPIDINNPAAITAWDNAYMSSEREMVQSITNQQIQYARERGDFTSAINTVAQLIDTPSAFVNKVNEVFHINLEGKGKVSNLKRDYQSQTVTGSPMIVTYDTWNSVMGTQHWVADLANNKVFIDNRVK